MSHADRVDGTCALCLSLAGSWWMISIHLKDGKVVEFDADKANKPG